MIWWEQTCETEATGRIKPNHPGLTSRWHSVLFTSDSKKFQFWFKAVHCLKMSEELWFSSEQGCKRTFSELKIGAEELWCRADSLWNSGHQCWIFLVLNSLDSAQIITDQLWNSVDWRWLTLGPQSCGFFGRLLVKNVKNLLILRTVNFWHQNGSLRNNTNRWLERHYKGKILKEDYISFFWSDWLCHLYFQFSSFLSTILQRK